MSTDWSTGASSGGTESPSACSKVLSLSKIRRAIEGYRSSVRVRPRELSCNVTPWSVDSPLKSGAERRALISWEKAHRIPIQLAMMTNTNRIAGTTHAVTELTPKKTSDRGAFAERPTMVPPSRQGGQAGLDPHLTAPKCSLALRPVNGCPKP